MRVFHVGAERFDELGGCPLALPEEGFVWIGAPRDEIEAALPDLQAALTRWGVGPLVDLHIADLLNANLPSHFDYTSWYDVMVFRRLAVGAGAAETPAQTPAEAAATAAPKPARRAMVTIDTTPVGFAVFDRVLLTVHPDDCGLLDFFAQRLAGQLRAAADVRAVARMPASPADLMLRMVNHIVDSYLDLRRLLTRQFDRLQTELLDPKSRFNDWTVLLDSRNVLHRLEDISEDQRSAVQEWIDALDEWPDEGSGDKRRERELLRVRSRDVLEHVERVLGHVRRLQQSAETAVQLHFSALSHRTNDIMRTLTVLTATFLPLNLVTGFFGMNFDALPLIHSSRGFWAATALMVILGVAGIVYFRRKRFLQTSRD